MHARGVAWLKFLFTFFSFFFVLLGTCKCDPPYNGDGCGNYEIGSISCGGAPSVVGTVGASESASFDIEIDQDGFVELEFVATGSVILFVSFGENVNEVKYDWRNDTGSPTLMISGARKGKFSGFLYSPDGSTGVGVAAQCTVLCPNSCTSKARGTCENGKCECNSPYSGDDCSEYVAHLGPEVDYTWPCNGAQHLILDMPPLMTELGIFSLSVNGTGTVYGGMDANNVNTASYVIKVEQDTTLSVIGEAAFGPWVLVMDGCTGNGTVLSFSLKAGCPNNCHAETNQGTCNSVTAVCSCVSPYQGVDCSQYVDIERRS